MFTKVFLMPTSRFLPSDVVRFSQTLRFPFNSLKTTSWLPSLFVNFPLRAAFSDEKSGFYVCQILWCKWVLNINSFPWVRLGFGTAANRHDIQEKSSQSQNNEVLVNFRANWPFPSNFRNPPWPQTARFVLPRSVIPRLFPDSEGERSAAQICCKVACIHASWLTRPHVTRGECAATSQPDRMTS